MAMPITFSRQNDVGSRKNTIVLVVVLVSESKPLSE